MPFTFSHPFLFLPLAKLHSRYISMTGLIIGSLLPDFEYFIRMSLRSDYSHSIGGIFYFDLPLGILLAFIFHNIVRNPLIDNLPPFLHSRFVSYKGFGWNYHFRKSYFVILISFLVGIASHLLMDGFTHNTGFFVERIPTLQHSLFSRLPLFKLLQYAGGLIGALFILYYVWRMPARKYIRNKPKLKFWFLWLIIMTGTIGVRMYFNFTSNVGYLVVIIISASLISLVLTSFIFRKNNLTMSN